MTISGYVPGVLALVFFSLAITCGVSVWRLFGLRRRFSMVIDADSEATRIIEGAEADATAREKEADNKSLYVETQATEEATRIIMDAEADASTREREADNKVLNLKMQAMKLEADLLNLNSDVEILRESYREKKITFDRLSHEVAILDERIAFVELGVYEPHFDFGTSEEFKQEIELVRTKQKAMISDKNAVVCGKTWSVDGSLAKGKTMTDRNIRLTLRAFNSECDASIANTRWNNANAMQKRIKNARAQIDRHNASNNISITQEYFDLKLGEMCLTHEYREKTKSEREERSELARAAKDEQRLVLEMEKAEREEAKYQQLLDKAKREAAGTAGQKLEEYEQEIENLQKKLDLVQIKVERAKAMAEITKCGYVYIISNIGSFGPDFIKIGLTRRLDPTDRVRELGDASVPFVFDTHAIIYSDDAPALERALHNEFATSRVNARNMRKEFFRASLEEVEAAVKRLAPLASFFKDIEAQDFHETMAIRNALLTEQIQTNSPLFPDEI